MATLYEVDKAIDQLIECGFAWDEETGEVLFDESDLDALEVELRDKLEACGAWMKNQRSLAKAIREEEKALADRRKAIERRLEWMDGYVLRSLSKFEGGRLETPKVALSTRKSTRVVVDSEEDLPAEFVQLVETVKADKTAIGKAIKAGEDVPGAHVEEKLNLQVR